MFQTSAGLPIKCVPPAGTDRLDSYFKIVKRYLNYFGNSPHDKLKSVTVREITRRRFQHARRTAETEGMSWLRTALLTALYATATGCLMPNAGTPVWVDARAGKFWSGRARLIEVSEDRLACRGVVRDRALFVHDRWVACASVHTRKERG